MFKRITDVKLVQVAHPRHKYEVWVAYASWYGRSWEMVKQFDSLPEAEVQYAHCEEIARNPVIKSFSVPILDERTISIQISHSVQPVEPNKYLSRKLKEAIRWMKESGIHRAAA